MRNLAKEYLSIRESLLKKIQDINAAIYKTGIDIHHSVWEVIPPWSFNQFSLVNIGFTKDSVGVSLERFDPYDEGFDEFITLNYLDEWDNKEESDILEYIKQKSEIAFNKDRERDIRSLELQLKSLKEKR